MKKKKLLTYLVLLGIILILLSFVFFIEYYFNYKKDQCVANPLVFGAKQLTTATGYEFVGSGFFLTPINIRGPVISFNSTEMWVGG
ncbi:MAG: hypothetical protein ACTSYG_10870 [Candidatus Heimdallarchaeota archaeon]